MSQQKNVFTVHAVTFTRSDGKCRSAVSGCRTPAVGFIEDDAQKTWQMTNERSQPACSHSHDGVKDDGSYSLQDMNRHRVLLVLCQAKATTCSVMCQCSQSPAIFSHLTLLLPCGAEVSLRLCAVYVWIFPAAFFLSSFFCSEIKVCWR